MNNSKISVYGTDRRTVLTRVSSRVTSSGASKAAGVYACKSCRVNGKYAWVAKPAPGAGYERA